MSQLPQFRALAFALAAALQPAPDDASSSISPDVLRAAAAIDWNNTPRYKAQEFALAVRQAADREVEFYATKYRAEHPLCGDKYQRRIAAAYREGLDGAADRYRFGRGGNFARPIRGAYEDGAALRKQMLAVAVQPVTAAVPTP
jgi:hypothetical protein